MTMLTRGVVLKCCGRGHKAGLSIPIKGNLNFNVDCKAFG